ncbi:hypothetical protein [Pseudogulbenkiania sp. MAI-1]|uniref:hypothetical protein n=1 Tax=Pseudogulbenkiania sp. MAI-1 TaxID=990370 RepID=UPI00045EA4BC|nr:hypothetical protein [Pseudogulbenkiania sp. MAI-1]
MYLILIGWLYVVLMMAVVQESPIRMAFIIVFLAVLPSLLFTRLVRRRLRKKKELAVVVNDESSA